MIPKQRAFRWCNKKLVPLWKSWKTWEFYVSWTHFHSCPTILVFGLIKLAARGRLKTFNYIALLSNCPSYCRKWIGSWYWLKFRSIELSWPSQGIWAMHSEPCAKTLSWQSAIQQAVAGEVLQKHLLDAPLLRLQKTPGDSCHKQATTSTA